MFGNRLILVTTGSMIPLLPLLWLVSGNFWYLIGVQVISGFVITSYSIHYTKLYDVPARVVLAEGRIVSLFDSRPGRVRQVAFRSNSVYVVVP